MTTKQFFVSLAALALPLVSQAKVRLPHLVSDGMVLQQQSEARLWGWDQPGKTVRVSVSWSNDVYTARADRDGKWLVKVKTPKASYTPLSVTFDDGEKTTIKNLLSGEVWVCAGQSNMEMPVGGFYNCPVKDYNNVVAEAAQNKGIRTTRSASGRLPMPTMWQTAAPWATSLPAWSTAWPTYPWDSSLPTRAARAWRAGSTRPI